MSDREMLKKMHAQFVLMHKLSCAEQIRLKERRVSLAKTIEAESRAAIAILTAHLEASEP